MADADGFVPGTLAPGGPRTWHVLVGGHSEGQAIQAEGYYPHVITIDAGDTVVWTLNTDEIHSVTFNGNLSGYFMCPPVRLYHQHRYQPLRIAQLRWCQLHRQFRQNGPRCIQLG